MTRHRTTAERWPPDDWMNWLQERLRRPLAIVLGSPREAAALVAASHLPEVSCYQMDLHQADRLHELLTERGETAQVVATADVWDLPTKFQTVVYPAPSGGERILKLDMVEQAFHILRPGGTFIVLSSYAGDHLFPGLLKKVFGKFPSVVKQSGSILWCRRGDDRPRRRHEMTFQARVGDDALQFLSRPGVFSYGRFDEGARALVETMRIGAVDHVLDLGCGCGTNGIFAARWCGSHGRVTFVDSNLRAVAVTALNAQANGLPKYRVAASSRAEELSDVLCDVVLANPPYYAQDAIARLFIERGRALLWPGGRFYLVTKRVEQIGPLMEECFGPIERVERRGYTVLSARKPATTGGTP